MTADGNFNDRRDRGAEAGSSCLQEFQLYATRSKFYMLGSDGTGNSFRVLTIDRLDPNDLNIYEDPTTYCKRESDEFLERLNGGNAPTGGLKSITSCNGIVGFVKFNGPYHMVLITKRKLIGTILGHDIYAIEKRALIPLSSSRQGSLFSKSSKIANRYKKLFCKIDLRKDFFFSYSYNIMHSLQKNSDIEETRLDSYESMFVWNGFLTRGIRSQVKNSLWTVPLVHGFFKQVKVSTFVKDFILTLISRRSKHYAGTRYLKRGINEEGRVANEVETEQLLFEDLPGNCSPKITSVVQYRGSIPLYWSQEISLLKYKPDIILKEKDKNFEATKLHFDDLAMRYGDPIVIWNLIKNSEKKHRESILCDEYIKAIYTINQDLPNYKSLRFLQWDLSAVAKREGSKVLTLLDGEAKRVLSVTGFFCGLLTKDRKFQDNINMLEHGSKEVAGKIQSRDVVKTSKFQSGVLRINCIDCLDRTNVAQYSYGLAALKQQLHSLNPKYHLATDGYLSYELMTLYEEMGDTLARQYGGSAAHNKLFSQKRGHWKVSIQSQEIFKAVHRFFSNIYKDQEKQNAIDVFLGNLQLEQSNETLPKPNLKKVGNVEKWLDTLANERSCLLCKQCKKPSHDGVSCESILVANAEEENLTDSAVSNSITLEKHNVLDKSAKKISVRGVNASLPRKTSVDSKHETDVSTCSNILDVEPYSSSANSYEEDFFLRSLISSLNVSCGVESIICNSLGSSIPPSEERSNILLGNEVNLKLA